MKGWSKARLREHKPAIAVIVALLLLWLLAVPASANPLEITDVSSGNITQTTATITWTTDLLANSTINYGNDSPPGLTAWDSAFDTNHVVNLTDLSPDTLYYYEVISTNQAGNETQVDNNGGFYYTFTTMMLPPTISEVSASNITDTTATITWTTDQQTDSTVNYGNTTEVLLTASDITPVSNHTINLAGLTPSTQYYYEVISTNSEQTATVSPGNNTYYTFTTAVHLDLEGWGWCTSYGDHATASLVGYATVVERGNDSQSFSVHAVGNLTLQVGNATPEIVPVDLYGSRVRSLFYLRQEVTGESSTFTGTWITGNDTQFYILTSGLLALPNPEGQSFKTARLYYLLLRTPGGDIPEKQPDGFAADLDTFIAWSTKYADRTITALVGTDVGRIIAEIIARIMTLIAQIRALGTPYFW
jgi:hypothetical protein